MRTIPHPATSEIELANVLRVVGDPVRLGLVRALADGEEHTCGELAGFLGMPDSTLSYHLRQLREAGVLRTRAQGTERHMSLRRDDLEARLPGLLEVLGA